MPGETLELGVGTRAGQGPRLYVQMPGEVGDGEQNVAHLNDGLCEAGGQPQRRRSSE